MRPHFLCLLISIVLSLPAIAQESKNSDLPSLRLQYRTKAQVLLHVLGQGEGEVGEVARVCKELGLPLRTVPDIGAIPTDCRDVHTILISTNGVDYFGSEASEEQKNEAINTLERFVGNGGHLVIFGSYNGRNVEKFSVFGLSTGFQHNAYFREVPGRSEVFFSDSLQSVPSPKLARSFGNHIIDPARKPVMMLQRGTVIAPAAPDVANLPDDSAISTFRYKRGRVTYTGIEPNVDAMWIVPIFVKWIARGAPTNAEQLTEKTVVSPAKLRDVSTPIDIMLPEDQAAAEKAFDSERKEAEGKLKSKEDRVKYAQQLGERSNAEINLSMRFVLLKEAALQLLLAGERNQFDNTVQELNQSFQFDLHEFRTRLIEDLGSLLDSDGLKDSIELLVQWSQDSLKENQFLLAQEYVAKASEMASTSDDESLKKTIESITSRVTPLAESELRVKGDIERSQREELDEAARTRLGIFYALVCNDWELGIPLLITSENDLLRQCAAFENEPSDDLDTTLLAAERWDAVAKDLQGTESHNAKLRARHWYLTVLPGLSGDQNKEVRSKLKALALPTKSLNFRLKLAGAGRLTVSRDGLSWEEVFGQPVSEIEVQDQKWNPTESPKIGGSELLRLFPSDLHFDAPKLKKIKGRSQVTLQRNDSGNVIVFLHDVPPGEDEYEFELELVE